MTLLDLKNHLFGHFLTESTFSLSDDVASLKLPRQDNTEMVQANKGVLLKLALDDMVRQGLVADAGGGLYILTQPLNSYSQTVTLDPMTIEMVSDLVNGFGEALGDEDGEPYVVNKLALQGSDITRLAHICHILLDDGPSTPSPGPGGPN